MSDPSFDDDSDLPGYVPPPALAEGSDLPGYTPVQAAPAQPKEPLGFLEQYAQMMQGANEAERLGSGVEAVKQQIPIVASALPIGAGMGALGRIGMNAAQGAGSSAAVSAIGDDRWSSDPMAAAWDALASGAVGGAVGGGSSALLEGAGALAGPIGKLSDKARLASMSTPAQFEKSAGRNGLDYTKDELVREAERLGIFNKVIPQSPAGIAERAESVMESAGPGYMGGIEAAEREGVTVPRDAIVDQMQGVRARAAADVGSNGAAQQRVADDLIERFGPAEGELGPLEAWAKKKNYQDSGGYVTGDMGRLPEGQSPVVNRQFGGIMRSALDDAMTGASPEAQASYTLGRQDFEPAADIAGLARGKEIAVDKRGLSGFGLGTLYDHYGMSAAGNALRGAQGLAGALGGASGVGAGLGSGAGGLMADELSQQVPHDPQMQRDQQKQERDRIQGAGRGHMIEGTIEQLLDSNPELFGDYESRFLEARGKSDPMAMSTLLQELQSDDKWRIQVLPQIQKATSRAGDF